MLFNCLAVCFLFNVPIDIYGESKDVTGSAVCFREDNIKQYNRLEGELGSSFSTYRIYNGEIIQSYVYGGSTICRADTKQEIDIKIMIWGGHSDAEFKGCRL